MRKLVFFVIGLFALFTLIKAYTSVRAAEDATLPATVPTAVTPVTAPGSSGFVDQPTQLLPKAGSPLQLDPAK